jgi:hypothetical protein
MVKQLNLAALTRSPTAIGALLVNLLPVGGILFFGWSLSALVVLYWLENLVIGLVNIGRILASGAAHGPVGIGGGLFLAAFFTLHYGAFCFGHGVFVAGLFGQDLGMLGPDNRIDLITLAEGALNAAPGLAGVLAAIAFWKLALFVFTFLLNGAYRTTGPHLEMGRPYGRIMFLHISIFAGAFALAAFGSPIWGVVILALGKTAYDVVMELREQAKLQEARKKLTQPKASAPSR